MVSADEAAALTLAAIDRRRQLAYVPPRWRLVSLAVRLMPSFIFRRLSF